MFNDVGDDPLDVVRDEETKKEGTSGVFRQVEDVVGAALGAFLIDLLDNSLIRWLEISEFWRDALLGLLILLAVATDAVVMNRLRSLWARSELQVEDGQPAAMEEGSYVS